ncbi:hypothetical protein EMIT0158MI4_60169 [Burkholderia ambifaria]
MLRPGRRWRGDLCAQRSRRRSDSRDDDANNVRHPSVSNLVSKKMYVLEIDLETVTALPDKADEPK